MAGEVDQHLRVLTALAEKLNSQHSHGNSQLCITHFEGIQYSFLSSEGPSHAYRLQECMLTDMHIHFFLIYKVVKYIKVRRLGIFRNKIVYSEKYPGGIYVDS